MMSHDPLLGGPPQRPIKDDLLLAVRLAWNIGYIVAIPVVLLGFGGAYLDRTWDTSPIFILLGFSLSLALSSVGIWRKLREIMPR